MKASSVNGDRAARKVVSRFGVGVKRYAGKQRDLGSNPLRFSFLFKSCGIPPPPFFPSLISLVVSVDVKHHVYLRNRIVRVQELCESRGGRPGLSVITSLTVSVDVKQYLTMLTHWSQLVPNNLCQPTSEDIQQHNSSKTACEKTTKRCCARPSCSTVGS